MWHGQGNGSRGYAYADLVGAREALEVWLDARRLGNAPGLNNQQSAHQLVVFQYVSCFVRLQRVAVVPIGWEDIWHDLVAQVVEEISQIDDSLHRPLLVDNSKAQSLVHCKDFLGLDLQDKDGTVQAKENQKGCQLLIALLRFHPLPCSLIRSFQIHHICISGLIILSRCLVGCRLSLAHCIP